MSKLLVSDIRQLSNGRVGIMTLNRPDQRNPLDKNTVREMNDVIDQYISDESIRSVVVTGAGDSFSAGGDLKGYLDLYRDEQLFRDFLSMINNLFEKLENGRLISVAAVNGICVAGGLELALACDLVVMSSAARIGDGHLQYWQLPGGGGTQRLPRAIGIAAAKSLFYTFDTIDAQRCFELGLATAVFDSTDFLAQTLNFVDRLMTTPSETILALKRLLRAVAEKPLSEGLKMEIEEVVGHAVGEEATAYRGLLRFVDRRK